MERRNCTIQKPLVSSFIRLVHILKDQKNQFGIVSIALHWIVAIALIMILLSGRELANGNPNLSYDEILLVHARVAYLVLPFFLFRLYWRLRQGYPEFTISKKLSHFIPPFQYLILISIFFSYLSSYFILNMDTNLWYLKQENIASMISEISIHTVVSKTAFLLIIIHIIAASIQILFAKNVNARRMISLPDNEKT